MRRTHSESELVVSIWGWINTNYHQKWVGEHPHKDYSIHFWDVHQGYLVLTNSHISLIMLKLVDLQD